MNSDVQILNYFIGNHPDTAIRILEQIHFDSVRSFLTDLSPELCAKVINRMEILLSVAYMKSIEPEKAAGLLQLIPEERAIYLLRYTESGFRKKILNLLPEQLARHIRQKLTYDAGSAGMLADLAICTLQDSMSLDQALNKLRTRRAGIMYYLYVVDQTGRLVGVANLRDVVLSGGKQSVSEIMKKEIVSLSSVMNYNAIIQHPGWQKHHTLPVTDSNGMFLGAVQYERLKQIERDRKGGGYRGNAIAAGNALGELFQIGLTGLLHGASSGLGRKDSVNNS